MHDVENAGTGGGAVNAYMFEVTMDQLTSPTQAEDVLIDVNITRWSFYKALTHAMLMRSCPDYGREVQLEDRLFTLKFRASRHKRVKTEADEDEEQEVPRSKMPADQAKQEDTSFLKGGDM